MVHRPSLGRTCAEWRVIRGDCWECGETHGWHTVDCELGNTEEP